MRDGSVLAAGPTWESPGSRKASLGGGPHARSDPGFQLGEHVGGVYPFRHFVFDKSCLQLPQVVCRLGTRPTFPCERAEARMRGSAATSRVGTGRPKVSSWS